MHKKNILIILAALLFALQYQITFAAAQDTIPKSLESRMAVKHYKSFSAGMEISYSNNPKLKTFVEYTLPNYPYVADEYKLKSFSSGLGFFASGELQLAKNFSAKIDYKYFIKSYNSDADIYANYDFSYFNHEIYLKGYMLFPVDYVIFKVGGGAGFIHSSFSKKYFGLESTYTANGLGLTLEGIMDVQLSKNLAAFINLGMYDRIQSNLKSDSGEELKASNGDGVNLNSFGVALRLGFEVFIF